MCVNFLVIFIYFWGIKIYFFLRNDIIGVLVFGLCENEDCIKGGELVGFLRGVE